MLKLLKREKGFTLIELMVVVLIIAILVAIAVPVFNVARSAAQKRTCQANLRTLDGAAQTYKAAQDAYPANIAAMVGDYIKEAPECPTDQAAYTYVPGSDPDEDTPTITCTGGYDGHSYP